MEERQAQQDELKRRTSSRAKAPSSSSGSSADAEEELQQTNEEIEEGSALLAEQKRSIEARTARRGAGSRWRAGRAAAFSRRTKRFRDMSHELRTR